MKKYINKLKNCYPIKFYPIITQIITIYKILYKNLPLKKITFTMLFSSELKINYVRLF